MFKMVKNTVEISNLSPKEIEQVVKSALSFCNLLTNQENIKNSLGTVHIKTNLLSALSKNQTVSLGESLPIYKNPCLTVYQSKDISIPFRTLGDIFIADNITKRLKGYIKKIEFTGDTEKIGPSKNNPYQDVVVHYENTKLHKKCQKEYKILKEVM